MKKNYFYALLGAIALTGAVGFSSCSSTEDTAENPNFNSETNEVTTQFVLNIASDEMPSTRQSAATVQKNNNFRGMMDAKLIGLSTGKSSSNWLAPFAGNSTGYAVNKTYDLGTLYSSSAVTNTNADDPENSSNRNGSSNRVVELTLPLNTDAMLVYGRAIRETTGDEEYGKVVYSINATPEDTKFELVPRMSSTTEYEQTLLLAQTVLNRIMLSEVDDYSYNAEHPLEYNGNGYKQKAALGAISWRGLGTSTSSLSPLEEILATLYKTIATTYAGADIHAGSAASICNMMKDAYTTIVSVYNAIATGDEELNAQRLAYEIKSRIEKYFDTDGTSFPFNPVGTSTTSGTILYALNSVGVSITGFSSVNNDNFKNFPVTFKLPEGVSQLKFTAFDESGSSITGGFEYLSLSDSHSLIDIANTLNPTKYTYPSELLYFDNSLLRVTDAEKAPAAYPNGYNVWDTESQWTGWTIGPVASTTRSVAVKNNINYGVAMLQTSVALGEAPNGYMDKRPELDAYKAKLNNNESLTTEEQTALHALTITENQIKEFKLTGVLIGGQYKQLGWNYLSTGEGENANYVIYDNKMNGATEADPGISIPTTSPNYTLVFDNYAAGGTQSDVVVALEFQNSDDVDIYGKGGMIPKGGKFYLAAKLPISGKTITTWPNTYAIPPYDNGAPTNIPRIFVQDFVTTATFKIGPNSLENAYTTVPDLRSSQISLGLSVDLNWRTGINFGDIILGQ